MGFAQPQPLDSKKILIKGFKYSAFPLGATILLCISTIVMNNLVLRRIDELSPELSTYNKYVAQIEANKVAIKKLTESTRSLVIALSGVRSGSALLTEVSKIIPRSIQLLTLKTNQSGLSLTATADTRFGLESINAFQLLLEESPFFEFSKVKLISATQQNENKNLFQPSPALPSTAISNIDSAMQFELSAEFSLNQANLTRPFLAQLGSSGLSQRIAILKSEGLLE